MLQNFKNARIGILYKNKSERGDCNNYRRLSLLCVTGKVLAKVLLNSFQQLCKDVYSESECVFRAQRSAKAVIFAVRQLLKKPMNRDSLSSLLLLAWQKSLI